MRSELTRLCALSDIRITSQFDEHIEASVNVFKKYFPFQIQNIQLEREMALASNRSLAEQNLDMKPRLESQKEVLVERYSQLEVVRKSYRQHCTLRGRRWWSQTHLSCWAEMTQKKMFSYSGSGSQHEIHKTILKRFQPCIPANAKDNTAHVMCCVMSTIMDCLWSLYDALKTCYPEKKT